MLGWQAMNHADLDQLLILQEKDVRISKLRKDLASLPEQRTRLLKQMEAIKQKALAAKNVAAQDITLGVRPSHMVLAKQPGNTLSATIDVSELMGSEIHFHANANGKDVVVIVPTMNADGERIDSYHAGDKLNLTFSGNVCHVFAKDGKNLEF